MRITDIINAQKAFDDEHGWSLPDKSVSNLLQMLNKDLIGFFGEAGEFANIIKKWNVEAESENGDIDAFFEMHRNDLEEEIVDIFVYVIRLITHLEMDMESAYFAKMQKTRVKYAGYKHKQ